MKVIILKRLFILITLPLLSCGKIFDPSVDQADVFTKEVRSLNGVKLIKPSLTTANNSDSYQQQVYNLGPQGRLLLRLENLSELSGGVVIQDEKRMYFQVTPFANQDLTAIRNGVNLCPLTRNWMMLATWFNAHPFPGGTGAWNSPGGDYLESECITAEIPSEELSEDKIYFDVSDWFVQYNQSRGQNYGWVITSIETLVIYGDSHLNFAPKLIWQIVR
ncbi:MAG: hypothetical protein K9K67_13045 [Bacteriovoracaceae bacterium]|nr:hypothetical protein [Bacteriovoracaceae bacterium]